MRILYLTSPNEDYLADSTFHGFRKLFGADCVDYPKCEILYENYDKALKKKIRGNGFSLYSGLLADIEVDRSNIEQKLKDYFFDLIVFGNVQRQYHLLRKYRKYISPKNTVLLDGEDTEKIFSAQGLWLRNPKLWFYPKVKNRFLYFKREWYPETVFTFWERILFKVLSGKVLPANNLREIAFSFPREKMFLYKLPKVQVFQTHIVDQEVAANVSYSHLQYAFETEKEYYEDIARSKFGITTKRAGWDCLRHYEIAANGTVLCFKMLDKKPKTCAPHGLIEGENCISYSNYENLISQIESMNEEEYIKLLENTRTWILSNTTEQTAQRIIVELNIFKSYS